MGNDMTDRNGWRVHFSEERRTRPKGLGAGLCHLPEASAREWQPGPLDTSRRLGVDS